MQFQYLNYKNKIFHSQKHIQIGKIFSTLLHLESLVGKQIINLKSIPIKNLKLSRKTKGNKIQHLSQEQSTIILF